MKRESELKKTIALNLKTKKLATIKMYKISYGKQHVRLYTCSSILALNALEIRAAQSPK
jgi:hypothetical protein